MANILDYLYWRGDIPFSAKPFNEIDAVILARLSYLRLDRFMLHDSMDAVPLPAAARKLLDGNGSLARPLSENNIRILNALLTSERFAGVELLFYRAVFDTKSQTQFAAVSFRLEKDLYYSAFRGTDNTLVGWKEDFNMSFSCPVPAQGESVRYLDSFGRKLGLLPPKNAEDEKMRVYAVSPKLRLIVGGHSKGGNLAVYSSAYCADAIQERIETIYNFDGPGFTEKVLSSAGYKHICERVRTFVPQSSIVGMLLEHEEKYTIVRSANNSIWQHDTFSWEIERDRFLRLESVTNSSRFIDYTLKNWMTSLEPAHRERFFDAVYTVLSDTKASTLKELSQNKLDTVRKVYRSLKKLDEQSRRDLTYTLKMFVKSAKVGMIKLMQDKQDTKLLPSG